MALSPSDRQKAYRERKKRHNFYGSSYLYHQLVELSADLDIQNDTLALIDDCYDVAGVDLVERIGLLLYAFMTMALAVQGTADHARKENSSENPEA